MALSKLDSSWASLLSAGSKLSTRNKGVLGAAAVGIIASYLYNRSSKTSRRSNDRSPSTSSEDVKKRRKATINKDFFRTLGKLLKILIPSIRSKESGLLVLHTIFLLIRTAASVYFATLDGQIVKSLVAGEGKQFMVYIIWWLTISVPISFVNSMLRYLQNRLSISFRSRLTAYVHKQYMEDAVYYKLENLDSRIQNADQLITQDISKFCDQFAELYSNLAKPAVDCIIYNAKLAHNVGFKGLFLITVLIHTGTFALRKFTPPFGRLVAEEQRLEGNYRFAHSRIITNAEEIAFYGGAEVEKGILARHYQSLLKHIDKVHRSKLGYGTLENFVVKYYWGALGFLICSLPVFTPFGRPAGTSGTSLSDHTKDFITNRRLLISTSDAFERLMLGYKDIIELAGYTQRVNDLLEVFDDVKNGRYQKGDLRITAFQNSQGTLEGSDHIRAENISIVSPNGDILVKNLTFEVPTGGHLLITGPNGCGKSSLFRILGGLWPVTEGTVYRPSKPNQIFYIPQRPYLSQGNLRDQIIYPDSIDQMKSKNLSDEDLKQVLDQVRLSYIVDREGGFDSIKEWKDVLSGGEKQRIAMARLFYHKPKYAILDECTSAVSIDVEGSMYMTAKSLGISLITVSHRPSLWKYHNYVLRFDGSGGYVFSELKHDDDNKDGDPHANLSLEDEKEMLRKRIDNDSNRVKKIDSLLGM